MRQLLEDGRVQVAYFPIRQAMHTIVLDMSLCPHIEFETEESPTGPDIAFLRLPIPFFDKIRHLVSFKNIDLGEKDAFADSEPSELSITVLPGVVSEWTKELQSKEAKMICALGNVGVIEDRIKTD